MIIRENIRRFLALPGMAFSVFADNRIVLYTDNGLEVRKSNPPARCILYASGPLKISGAATLFLIHSYSLEPLHHAEHHAHRYEADDHEHQPAHPLVAETVVHKRADPDEEVSDSRSS